MATLIKCKTSTGQDVEFFDEVIGSGAMKDVHFSPDRSYVVAFYKSKQDYQARERLQMIVGKYRDMIFNQSGGDYWSNLFCWPTDTLEHNGKLGLVAPTYPNHFFFEHGSKNNDMLGIRGKEKEGKWFAAANLRSRFVDAREIGKWSNYLRMFILLARAVKKMHMMGLAHSDLSYKNVLVDPSNGFACVIDVDGLVVPGKFPPDVVGTPDFIAPEVVMTSHLPKDDPLRKLPRRETDLHALSVLIYMYLLYRHPLRGSKVHDLNDELRDENLMMGERALFVEHPVDKSNRIKVADAKPSELPWADTQKLPYTLTGPYLSSLFYQSFVTGLHSPESRPSANDWEIALVKTVDLIQPCSNVKCDQKWYVFDNKLNPCCPFCGQPHQGLLPVLNLYSARKVGKYLPDNHRLMVWTGQSLFLWHVNGLIAPNEKLTDEQKRRVGYFVFHNNFWWLVNERMPELAEILTDGPKSIQVGSKVQLKDGQKLIFSKQEGGRLAVVQMVGS